MRTQALLIILLVGFMAGSAVAAAKPVKPILTLQEVEKKMLRGGYLDTLNAAYWAVAQGEAAVPLLAKLLENRAKYAREPGAATGAFPYNALWALAHIPKTGALEALEKYYFASKDPAAALAIQGWRLRAREQNPRYGVLTKEAVLLEGPHKQARVIKRIKPGQQVKILTEKNLSPKEKGPGGGPVFYARVDLIPSGERGYITLRLDDFTPFI